MHKLAVRVMWISPETDKCFFIFELISQQGIKCTSLLNGRMCVFPFKSFSNSYDNYKWQVFLHIISNHLCETKTSTISTGLLAL